MMEEISQSLQRRLSTSFLAPAKRTLAGNFTSELKQFYVIPHKRPGQPRQRRDSMRQDILEEVIKKTESMMDGSENPMYEDPRDIIGVGAAPTARGGGVGAWRSSASWQSQRRASNKPAKPPRKRTIQAIAVSSPRQKEHRSLLREQKRKLTKKYENLINTLMDRCEDNIVALSEKDSLITKLKEKLRSVLEYNRLFAEENETLRNQYEALSKYVEECKSIVREEREKNRDLEKKNRDLEERVNKFEVPDRDMSANQAIPLVEVCMSCSSRQIVLSQAREHNARLQKDMQAMKDVLYRLNVQLSRYQEKIRSNIHHIADGKADFRHGDTLDSIIHLGTKTPDTVTDDGHTNKSEEQNTARLVDLSGLLSAQALAPLFDAYQENLQEKDTLIGDYEKQFENINKKSKQIVEENKALSERVSNMEEELTRVRQSYKKTTVEKETVDIEKATLLERAERAETKLKEVYELYEDKMAAMMRDYETVHREYFTVKNALEATEGKMAQLDILRGRTVPADLHERRLDHCKRLLEELKHQYGMEAERKTEQSSKLQEQTKLMEEKYNKLCKEHELCKEELEKALKNVRLYRKAAVIFRSRLKAASARSSRVRSSVKQARNEPLRQALHALDKIKNEIKVVKSRAYSSLEELERRIREQERRAATAQTSHRREMERARLALEHKEGVIRSLIDKVADVEEVRLSQTNTHRLQGIIDTSPEPSISEIEAGPFRDEPRTFKDGPTTFKDGPRTFKDGPRTFKDGPRTFKDGPRTYKDDHKTSREDNRTYKNGSRPRDDSKTRDEIRAFKHDPKTFKEDPKTTTDDSRTKDEIRTFNDEPRAFMDDPRNTRDSSRTRDESRAVRDDHRNSRDEPGNSKDDSRNIKLVPGDGGYFQDREGRRKGKE